MRTDRSADRQAGKQADRQTNVKNLVVDFRNFANLPNYNFTIQINQPTRCNSFTSLLLDVLCRSTCFGRLHAHHQKLTTALTASGRGLAG